LGTKTHEGLCLKHTDGIPGGYVATPHGHHSPARLLLLALTWTS
jgi:hypothetical protein